MIISGGNDLFEATPECAVAIENFVGPDAVGFAEFRRSNGTLIGSEFGGYAALDETLFEGMYSGGWVGTLLLTCR